MNFVQVTIRILWVHSSLQQFTFNTAWRVLPAPDIQFNLHSSFDHSRMKFSNTFPLALFFSCFMALSYGSQTKSMQNKHITVSAEPWRPFFLFYCDGKSLDWTQRCHEGGKVTCGGSLYELLKFMERARNVTFTIIRTSGGNWGHCHEKDNCTGMIGVVNRQEADIAIGISLF